MKKEKTIILGVEVTIRNTREKHFAQIVKNEIASCVQWVDENTDSKIKSNTEMSQRYSIANSIARDVDGFFTSMYYLHMIDEPQMITLNDILDYYNMN